jgi:hypothetical protein
VERDVVMSVVPVETFGSGGYRTLCSRAARSQMSLSRGTMSRNLSSIVSLCAHSSIDTYFHPDRTARFFFGFRGYFGFFTVFGEVDDDGSIVRDGSE